MSTMDAATLAALRGSIAKWRAIADGTGTDLGPNNCPLCQAFLKNDCEGCPVSARTRATGCADTPYDYYVQAEDDHDDSLMADAAEAELAFLVSLLPDGERP